MGVCFLYGNSGGSGRSNNYWIINVYGGANPPASGVKKYDIFLRTSVALLRGELTTNIQSTPGWTDSDGAFIISLVGGILPGASVGAYFAYNAQHKNFSMSGYPGQAYIFENGGWRRCDGYIWDGSAWLQFSLAWDGTLFYNGDQYTSVTGGWKTYYGAISEDTSYLYATGMSGVRLGTASAINMTGYSQLHVIGGGYGEYIESGSAKNITHTVGVSDDPAAGTFLASASLPRAYGVGSVGEVIIDISSISGSHYVSTTAWKSGVSAGVYLTKVWLK